MIGVISKPTEVAEVEEFFQLFKTPWEFLERGRAYDVVLATADEIPKVNAKLLIIYGSGMKSSDSRAGIRGRSQVSDVMLNFEDARLPVYGAVRTFEEVGRGMLTVSGGTDIAGLRLVSCGLTMYRFGYDLFRQVGFLLTTGQPAENAHIAALELHIGMLRSCILEEGISIVEIPPVPAGYDFIVCLTHDIDFVGIRSHRFDHTMWGFLYRSTVGAVLDFARRKISFRRLIKMFGAAVSLPLVYLGWIRDFWMPFDWYLRLEKGLSPTYFLIPFKNRPGEKVSVRHAERRATAYDVADLVDWTRRLIRDGCEIGVHGIDAWHSAEKGRGELARVSTVTGLASRGIRMHWLLQDVKTPRVLEEAGYDYDSTVGYNETVGYRAGTTQVYLPLGNQTLLELPMHIQDGALFFPNRLGLSDNEAWKVCEKLIAQTQAFGGVLTVLWHDRSHGPERFWGEFYSKLVQTLRSLESWFGTATQVVGWFRKRREVSFQRVAATEGTRTRLHYEGEQIQPALRIRVYRPGRRCNDGESSAEGTTEFVDIPWNGKSVDDLELQMTSRVPEAASHISGTIASRMSDTVA